MKMLTIPVFILLFTGYLCNAQSSTAESPWNISSTEEIHAASPPMPESETHTSDHLPEISHPTLVESQLIHTVGSLPTLVVAGVSIALVLLCILIVAIFWYAWKKSQEGSMVLNPIPYGAEAAVSFQNPSLSESQQGWPSERAVP